MAACGCLVLFPGSQFTCVFVCVYTRVLACVTMRDIVSKIDVVT